MSTYIPALALISGITNAANAVVTFSAPHTFVNAELISFRVTKAYGMVEMNNQRAQVLSTSTNAVTVNIDSTNYTPFTTPGSLKGTTPPCAVPSSSGVDRTPVVPIMILNDAFDNEPLI